MGLCHLELLSDYGVDAGSIRGWFLVGTERGTTVVRWHFAWEVVGVVVGLGVAAGGHDVRAAGCRFVFGSGLAILDDVGCGRVGMTVVVGAGASGAGVVGCG